MESSSAEALTRNVAAGAAAVFGELLVRLREQLAELDRFAQRERDFIGRQRALGATRALLNRGDELVSALAAYAGARILSPTAIDMTEFLQSLAQVLRRSLDRRVEVEVQVQRGCPACCADAAALEQAVLELVRNARDAMPQGGRLRLLAADAGMDGMAVSIADTGVGIAIDDLSRVALPFFTTWSGSEMAGMGLAAAGGFARQSGGSMRINSRIGVGTTVTLYLPRATAGH